MVSNKFHKSPQINLKRSKISLSKVAESGINPVTGEYLSAAERKNLFKKRNVNASKIFGKGGAIIKMPSSSLLSPATLDKKSLEERVFSLESQFSSLAKAIQKESELEKKIQREKEKNELREAERVSRGKEETLLEKSVESSRKRLLSPIEKVTGKAKDAISKIQDFFLLLLGGWLTNQGIAAIKADAEGNEAELENIKNEVKNVLGIVGGIFLALNGGIALTLTLLRKLAAKILKFSWNRTIGALINKIRNRGGRTKPPRGGSPQSGSPRGGSPQGNSKPGYKDPGRNRSPGQVKAGGDFRSQQVRSELTKNNMLKKEGPKNLLDRIKHLIRGKFAELETTRLGRTMGKVQGLMKNNPLFRLASKIPFVNKLSGAVDNVKKISTKENLGKIGNKLGKFFRRSFAILNAILTIGEISGRAQSGMSPAQAILPMLFKTLLTIGGGFLGGAAIPVPGLNFLTAMAGSWAGGWLGDQITNFFDSNWSSDWDTGLFKGFNDTIKNIGVSDPTGLVGTLFPWGNNKDIAKSGEEAPVPRTADSKITPNPSLSPTTTTPSTPSTLASANGSSSISSMSMPTPNIGPAADNSEPEIIYRRASSGNNGQQASLKSGSASDVPLISAFNPDNFYVLFSLVNYNVVA